MLQEPAFQQFQRALAAHLRDPHHVKKPDGVPTRRVRVYQELLFNNICGFLDKCFPVSREILGEARWARLSRTFYRDWPLHDPLFCHIPREFVAYVASGSVRQPLPVWLAELVHYEWVELAVDIMDVSPEFGPSVADPLGSRLIMNPASMMMSYVWPVHRISKNYKPRKPPVVPTHLVVYRDAECDVRFMEINTVTARLLTLLGEGATGHAALDALAVEMRHPAPDRLREFGASLLADLASKGVVLRDPR